MANGDLVYIPDHAATALSQMLAQWKQQPVISSLVLGLGAGAQHFEDGTFDALTSTTLPEARWWSLDQWGALVGEDRGDLSDGVYRQFISARILANKSRGTTDELIAILQLLTDPSTVTHRNIYPATARFQVVRPFLMDDSQARRVIQLMDETKPAGVRLVVTEAVADAYFGFKGDPNARGYGVGRFSRRL